MKKNKLKGNKSFLALVLSDKRPDFRDILVNLGPHLKGMDNSKNPEKWNHLEFDFEHIHKVDIYIRFARDAAVGHSCSLQVQQGASRGPGAESDRESGA